MIRINDTKFSLYGKSNAVQQKFNCANTSLLHGVCMCDTINFVGKSKSEKKFLNFNSSNFQDDKLSKSINKFEMELSSYVSASSNKVDFDTKYTSKIYEDYSNLLIETADCDDAEKKRCILGLLIESLDKSEDAKTSSFLTDLLIEYFDAFCEEDFLSETLKYYTEGNMLRRPELKMFLANRLKTLSL